MSSRLVRWEAVGWPAPAVGRAGSRGASPTRVAADLRDRGGCGLLRIRQAGFDSERVVCLRPSRGSQISGNRHRGRKLSGRTTAWEDLMDSSGKEQLVRGMMASPHPTE